VNLFMATPGFGHPGPEAETLNALLRHELAAIQAYTQALGRFAGHPSRSDLHQIRHAHEMAADVLRDHIHNCGGEPDGAFGPADAFAGPVTSAGNLEAVCGALKVGEERRLAEYEAFLQAEEMPQECRFAVRAQLLPQCHEHIDILAGLAEGPRANG
jgi:hypothetical protein